MKLLLSKLKSWLVHTNSAATWPIIQFLIRLYIRVCKVDLREAELTNPIDYQSINHLFTRRLKPSARPINQDSQVLNSPCDGIVTAHGQIVENQLIQAKGMSYSLNELINQNDEIDNSKFLSFVTLYLSPRHYHRAHAPLACKLTHSVYIPGKFFSVSPKHSRLIPNLYIQNERLVLHYHNEDHGNFVVVMVGSKIVSSISTPWLKSAEKYHPPLIKLKPPQPIICKKGDEIANFNMGSTIIVLTEKKPKEYCFTSSANEVKVNSALAVF